MNLYRSVDVINSKAMDPKIEIPSKIAVMILPETVLFPGGLLPLFIFEPRYQAMLAAALESHRMFAIALVRSHEEEAFPVGCVGLVRACVMNPDGSAHLMLQGVARVRFVNWLEETSFPQAKVELLHSESSSATKAKTLRAEIVNLSTQLSEEHEEARRRIKSLSETTRDPAEFCDQVSSALVGDSVIRQRLLEEPVVETRLAILAACLSRIVAPD